MNRLALLSVPLLLAGCQYVHDGWAFQPFQGPAFDIKDGLLIDAEEGQTFVIAATYLPVSKDSRDLFGERMDAIQAELDAEPDGLIGYALAQKLVGSDEYRTVTVWEDEDAMMAFVLGEAHLAAMASSTQIKDPEGEARVHRWEIAADALPPVWDDVIEMTDSQGRAVAY